MKTINIITVNLLIAVMGIFTACTQEEYEYVDVDIVGNVQKGPFISGSTLTLYDLYPNLNPTGKVYSTQIFDNKGGFDVGRLMLSSYWVELKAEGYYYNEVTGEKTKSPIALSAVADILDKSTVNVNVLTHLEKDRVEYLMRNGEKFADAKTQAQKEILAIFNIAPTSATKSETLSICGSTESDAILLAVSSILQGNNGESDLIELMANIINDIRTDGTLDSESIGTQLINNAASLNLEQIKTNMQKLYPNYSSTNACFGKYITNFIAQTEYKVTKR